MTKQEKFLYMVQTVILANGINLSIDDDAKENRHLFSATGVIGLMNDAIEASETIPEDMNAQNAADEFCGFMLDNLRQPGEKVPYWFAKPLQQNIER